MQRQQIMPRTKKTATMEINFWLGNDDHIHIAGKGRGIISTVSDDPASKRYHPNLYKKLKAVLQQSGL